jgi:hypothetical protein
MRVLVITSEPISARQLRDGLGQDTALDDVEVMVVAPAVQENPIKFWMSDADEAIARAKEVRTETVERLDREGIQAAGDTGESDPAEAIQDALQTFPADRILVFAHGAYREDVDETEIEERFGVPVTRV